MWKIDSALMNSMAKSTFCPVRVQSNSFMHYAGHGLDTGRDILPAQASD
jgi:hypothetical protein